MRPTAWSRELHVAPACFSMRPAFVLGSIWCLYFCPCHAGIRGRLARFPPMSLWKLWEKQLITQTSLLLNPNPQLFCNLVVLYPMCPKWNTFWGNGQIYHSFWFISVTWTKDPWKLFKNKFLRQVSLSLGHTHPHATPLGKGFRLFFLLLTLSGSHPPKDGMEGGLGVT